MNERAVERRSRNEEEFSSPEEEQQTGTQVAIRGGEFDRAHIGPSNYTLTKYDCERIHIHQGTTQIIYQGASSSAESSGSDLQNNPDAIRLSDSIYMFPNKKITKSGKVVLGQQTSSLHEPRCLAIKVLNYDAKHVEETQTLLKLATHNNVVTIIHADVFSLGPVKQIYIAMELCHQQDLYEHVNESKINRFDPELSVSHAKQLVEGLNHIHSNNIIHRDLKPHNVLLSLDKKTLKIADFGISKEMKDGNTSAYVTNTREGTDGYRAPETYNSNEISQKADIFSLGLVIYFLWSNGHHAYGDDPDDWNSNIKRNNNRDLSHLCVPNKEGAEKLLSSMLEFQPEHRPTTEQIIKHDYFHISEDPRSRLTKADLSEREIALLDYEDHLNELLKTAENHIMSGELVVEEIRSIVSTCQSLKHSPNDAKSEADKHMNNGRLVRAYIMCVCASKLHMIYSRPTVALEGIHQCSGSVKDIAMQMSQKAEQRDIIKKFIVPSMYDMLADLREIRNPNNAVIELSCMYRIGRSHNEVFQNDKALEQYKQGIQLMKRVFNSDAGAYHIYGDLLHGVAVSYMNMGRIEDAVTYFSKSVASKERAEDFLNEEKKMESVRITKQKLQEAEKERSQYSLLSLENRIRRFSVPNRSSGLYDEMSTFYKTLFTDLKKAEDLEEKLEIIQKMADCQVKCERSFEVELKKILEVCSEIGLCPGDIMSRAERQFDDGNYVRSYVMYVAASKMHRRNDRRCRSTNVIKGIAECIKQLNEIMKHLLTQTLTERVASLQIIPSMREMLKSLQEVKDLDRHDKIVMEASLFSRIGRIHETIGDHMTALCSYEEGLKIIKHGFGDDTSKHWIHGGLLHNMSLTYQNMGDHEHAIMHYKATIEAKQKAEDFKSEEMKLRSIEKARRHLQSCKKDMTNRSEQPTATIEADDADYIVPENQTSESAERQRYITIERENPYETIEEPTSSSTRINHATNEAGRSQRIPGSSKERPQHIMTSIGPEGGNICINGCQVVFPPGAVVTPTEFYLSLFVDFDLCPDGYFFISPIISCLPAIKFHKPVKVRLFTWYTTTQNDITVNLMKNDSDDLSGWDKIHQVTLQENLNTIELQTDHFTLFSAFLQRVFYPKVSISLSVGLHYSRDGNFSVIFCPADTTVMRKCKQQLAESGFIPVSVSLDPVSAKCESFLQVWLKSSTDGISLDPKLPQTLQLDRSLARRLYKSVSFRLVDLPDPDHLLRLECVINGRQVPFNLRWPTHEILPESPLNRYDISGSSVTIIQN